MNRVKIHCRAITPIFMSGVDGGVAELRASEFKGMMRWWWRAVVADDKIDRLKREESSIFGGTGAEEERKSKVELRIEEFKVIKEGNLIRSEGLEWRFDKKERRLVGKHAGIGYLLYSTILPGRERGYIKSGSEFDIVLRAFDDESFAVGLASLWLAIYLGGFGTRARRGGGNIQVVNEIKEFDGFSFKVAGRNADEVARWIVSNFEKVFSFVKRDKTRSIANTYSNVSRSRFIIAKNHKGNWVEALNEIGEMYLFFRKKHRKRVFELGAFGIPVVYSSRGKLVSTKSGRRSSPLIFKVVESEGKYYWMVIRLSGEFLPVDEKLRFGNRLVKPSYSLVDELWSDLKKIGDEHMFFKDSVEAREVARVIKY